MNIWDTVVESIYRIPPAFWMILGAATVACTWKIARRRMHRAGQRVADPELVAGRRARAKDTALTVASMIPAILFWAMVLAGSFRGLVAFGRNTLRWQDGWEYLVPGSLDGVSVTFALLAFRAIRKQKAPDRSYRVVWGAAITSALVNFSYEYSASNHNLVAGAYLALLSLFGMVMFHEFLAQFEEGSKYVRRRKPSFGMRWITWPHNTFCAWLAWNNHPPANGTAATVHNAVANLERVRGLRTARREATREERHNRALEHARRRAELAAARTGANPDSKTPGEVNDPENGSTARGLNGRVHGRRVASSAGHSVEASTVRVPSTDWKLRQWIDTWVRLCDDGDIALGPLTDEEYARTTYDLSAKQLRNIRRAATSGALRRQASEVGVPLPVGYVDDPRLAEPAGSQASGDTGRRRGSSSRS